MRAAVLTEAHTFQVIEIPDPTAGSDELILQVHASGICGSDVKYHTLLPVGSVLGHEFCGEIVAVGTAGKGKWRERQRAAALPRAARGRCHWRLGDEPAHCAHVDLFGIGGSPGAFAQYVRVAVAQTITLSAGVGFGLAVAVWAARAGAIRGLLPPHRIRRSGEATRVRRAQCKTRS